MAEETAKQNAETTETTEKKEGFFMRVGNFLKRHVKDFAITGAGVGLGILLASLAGGKDESNSEEGYYDYSSSSEEGDVEEGGSEE